MLVLSNSPLKRTRLRFAVVVVIFPDFKTENEREACEGTTA